MGFRRYGLLIALSCLVADLYAHEEETTSSSLSLELGRDSDHAEEGYLDLDTGLPNGIHLRWMSGGTRLDTEADAFETRSRSLGISSDYSAPLVAGFDYDYWGNPDTVETRTRRFKLGANTENWYVQLVYEDRTTRLRTNGSIVTRRGIVIDLPDVVDVGSIGRGIEVSYYGLFPVSINASYMEYDYDKNVAGFAQYPDYMLLLFPASTVSVATGLEARRRSGDISYAFGWGTLGLSGSQSESVVDESVASSGSIYLIWDMAYNWSSTFTWGESRTDTSNETVRFGRVALTHRW